MATPLVVETKGTYENSGPISVSTSSSENSRRISVSASSSFAVANPENIAEAINVVKQLNREMDELKLEYGRMEKRIEQTSGVVLAVTIGVIVIFCMTLVPLVVTYNTDQGKLHREVINQILILKTRVDTMESLMSNK